MRARLSSPRAVLAPPRPRLRMIMLAAVGVLLVLIALHTVGVGLTTGSASSASETHPSASHPLDAPDAPTIASMQTQTLTQAQTQMPEPAPAPTSAGIGALGSNCGGLCSMGHLAMAVGCAMILLSAVLAARLPRTLSPPALPPRILANSGAFRPLSAPRRTPSLIALSISRI